MSSTVVVVFLLLVVACLVATGDEAVLLEDLKLDELPLFSAYPTWDSLPVSDEVGDKLILTDLIEAGQIEEARALAAVSGGPFPDDIPSYSGFFTVNKEFNSNSFFWFFPAEVSPAGISLENIISSLYCLQQDYENAPVILWMQGGPGTSSLYGLFVELGPYNVDFDDVTLIKNPYSWHKNHSLIFIDNPVGTGFSFTDFNQGYATNQTQIGSELYIAMIQFFTMFPELQTNDFFVAGESFAGKYVPALAYTIHINNPTADLKINLQGIAVGNGFTDPDTILNYSEYVFQLGLVDERVRAEMAASEERSRQNILNGSMIKAWQEWNNALVLWNVNSEYKFSYNILYQNRPVVGGDFFTFVQETEVRKLLHVGDAEYTSNGLVYSKMIPEFMLTVRPWLEVLMENYRVLYYNGHLDVVVAYSLSADMYQTLQWTGREQYLAAPRQPWYVGNDELAGYMRKSGNFTEVIVRNAGHMVPLDQPVWALDLITKFTFDHMP